MKRVGRLKNRFLTKETIKEAIEHHCRTEKRNKWSSSMRKRWEAILRHKEEVIDNLLIRLGNQTYKFSPFNIFKKREGSKDRIIYSSTPLDLIVDYILDKCLKYVFTEKKKIIHKNCYGSVKNKGQHELRKKIINRLKGKEGRIYVASCDTKKYYPTIDQEILYNTLKKHIKCQWCLWLCKLMISRIPGGKGIALGTATSNILGHIYHACIDWRYILGGGLGGYYRFCDDKLIIHTDKNLLRNIIYSLQEDTKEMLNQEIKKSWRIVGLSKGQCIEFLGALISSRGARLSTASRRRVEKHFKKEINLPFDIKRDKDRVLRTWAGVKGSMRDLRCKGLIKYWVKDSKYREFFNRLRLIMEGNKNPILPYPYPIKANKMITSIGFHYNPVTNQIKMVYG